MKIQIIKERFYYAAAIGISIFLLFFVITCTWIGYDVNNQCINAKRQYSGDCVEALSSLLKDENRDFHLRNSAIWALGQLGDKRALPTLQSLYTGNIPERESLYKTISQYELKKAINLTGGGTNISALVWRHGSFLFLEK